MPRRLAPAQPGSSRLWGATARRSLLLLSVLLATCALGACGSSSRPRAGHTAASSADSFPPPPPPLETKPGSDEDGDGDGGADDVNWGSPGSAADVRAVSALVKRFYAAGVAGQGGVACSLMYSLFAEEVPEVYGEASGPPALRGSTCAAVMDGLFRARHRELAAEVPALRVSRVRVKRLRGLVILDLGKPKEHDIPIHLEHGVWKINALIDSNLG